MKKLALCLLSVLMILSLGACSKKENKSDFDPIAEFGSDTLNVFNWGEYIGEETQKAFEEKYNVKVNYKMFDSNEEMYTSMIMGDSYDVIYPSDYMVERLIKEGRIQKLDTSLITNIDKIADGLASPDYDPAHEYSIPYFQGSVGIAYNKNMVTIEELEAEGWNILVNPKYKGQIFVYDADRDNFMPAFKALGYSMNTTDEAEIEAAYQWLLNQAKTMEPAYGTDEINDDMINGNYALAICYSGAASYIISENDEIGYYEPKQGTNVWSDAMCIPTDAKNVKLAHAWINFNLEKEVAMDNSIYVGYTSGQKEALAELSAEGGEFDGIEAYTPRVGYELDEEYHDDNVLKEKLAELWVKVKATKGE
ncbi:MAG: extracellular solute-binding protein [Erysipelotrichaceae bacterium]|nr:extracellular solute-binding protein [Erysipelotrichaceae bacterium]